MTFSLTVDATQFRSHLSSVVEKFETAGALVVPVIKGNGYGFTRATLVNEVKHLGLKRIAIGTVWELAEALAQFSGEILVLEPFKAQDKLALSQWEIILQHNAARVIVTLSDLDFAAASAAGVSQVYLDGITSLTRFGLKSAEISQVSQLNSSNLSVRGLVLHLPIVDSQKNIGVTAEISRAVDSNKLSGKLLEIWTWIIRYQEVATTLHFPMQVSLSHMSSHDVTALKQMCKSYNFEIDFDIRVGTALWLDSPESLVVQGTVLQVHELKNLDHVGYQQIETAGHKRLIVVSGGTAHGVALAAPTARNNLRKKGIAIVEGLSQALGKVRSPFSRDGHNFVFAEPPHMHVSLLWTDDPTIKIGDALDCQVRNTTADFDQVLGLN